MSTPKIYRWLIVWGMATALCGGLGLYAGAALYFKLTHIPLQYLELDSLINQWRTYHTDPDIKKYLAVGWLVCAVLTAAPSLMALWIAIATQEKKALHGAARFADDRELAQSGLFPKTPPSSPTLILGKVQKGRFKNCFVELGGQSFLGVSAPTGSGKGVGVVQTNLLHYEGSVVCTDIKFENFIKTAGFRQAHGHEIILFAPDGYAATEAERKAGQLRSCRWNPLQTIRRRPEFRVGDIQVIANSLYPLTGKDDIWPQSAQKLFLGLILFLLDTEADQDTPPTLPDLLTIIGVHGGLAKWMEGQLEKAEKKPNHLSGECRQEFNAFLSFPDNTQGSILANLNAPLNIFKDQTVAQAVSGNDFELGDLRKRPISLYVGVQPPNIGHFKVLLNLFVELLIAENTRVLPEFDPTLTQQCLLLLDEFPALGPVNQIQTSIAFTRQYNLRYLLIYQDKSQLESPKMYGKEGADSLIENLTAEIIFPPKKVDARVKSICETLGTQTVRVHSESRTRGKTTSRSRNTSEQKRPLLMPQELIELGHETYPGTEIGRHVLLLKERQRPFVMDKLVSFKEPEFAKRMAYSKNNVPTIPLLKVQNQRENTAPSPTPTGRAPSTHSLCPKSGG